MVVINQFTDHQIEENGINHEIKQNQISYQPSSLPALLEGLPLARGRSFGFLQRDPEE